MNSKRISIITKRLVLAPINEKDRDRGIHLFSHPLVKKTYMIPDFTSREDANAFFERVMNLTKSSEHYAYGIFKEGNLIGFINDVVIQGDEIEIGYLISPDDWNKGYATEALKAMIEELFRVGFNKVLAAHFENNLSSGKVMEKCDMHKNGYTEPINYKGEEHTCTYYEILKY